jgi:hypothetical protein
MNPWNAQTLEKLCVDTNPDDVEQFLRDVEQLDPERLGDDNDRRAVVLIHNAKKIVKDAYERLNTMVKTTFPSIKEVIEAGQFYFSCVDSGYDNISLSLKRIKYTGSSEFIKIGLIPPLPLTFYFKYVLNISQSSHREMVAVLEQLDCDNNTKMREEYIKWCPCNTFDIERLPPDSIKYIELVGKIAPIHYQQFTFRISLLKSCVIEPQIVLRNNDYVNEHSLLRVQYEIIPLLPLFTEYDLNIVRRMYKEEEDILTNTLKQVEERQAEKRRLCRVIPLRELSFDQFCLAIKNVGDCGYTQEHLYICNTFYEEFMNNNVHSFLVNTLTMLRIFHTNPLNDTKQKQLNQFLNSYLSGIGDVSDYCACCLQPFARFIEELDGVEDKVVLSKETQDLLQCLRVSVRLPVLEESWGFYKSEQKEVPIDYDDLDLDDGIPLERFDDSEDK